MITRAGKGRSVGGSILDALVVMAMVMGVAIWQRQSNLKRVPFAVTYDGGAALDGHGVDYAERIYEERLRKAVKGTFNTAATLSVAIIESWGVHDEVTASFLRAMAPLEDVQTTAFLRDERFGIWQLYKRMPWRNDYNQQYVGTFSRSIQMHNYAPHAAILTSCHHDVSTAYDSLALEALLVNTNTTLYCVVHETYEWDDLAQGEQNVELQRTARQNMRRWIDAGRVHWITLGEHVTKALEYTVFPVLHVDPSTAITHTWTPVFDWREGLTDMDSDENDEFEHDYRRADVAATTTIELAVQGSFESHRRNYRQLFDSWRNYAHWHATSVSKQRLMARVRFLILGQEVFWEPNPASKLPQDIIREKATLVSGLHYKDYYARLSKATLLLPTFAGDEYMRWKASSTMAASVIAGVPLVVEEDTLQRYTYLTPTTVWMRGESESELDAALRVACMHPALQAEKRAALHSLRASLIRDNVYNIQSWLLASS